MTEPLVNRAQYGRLVRAARVLSGFDRVEDASREIDRITGFSISTRTLYAIERGEQSVTLEQFLAIAWAFDPPSGFAFWARSFSSEMQQFEKSARRAAFGEVGL